jgi:hypothetical protein
MLPTLQALEGGRLRLYYGALDEQSVARIRWLEVALSKPTVVERAAAEPVLEIGEPGFFDDNGVVPTCVVRAGGELRLYYAGFQKQTKIAYTMFTGLAVSHDGGDVFRRASTTPVLDRSQAEPFFRTAAWLLAGESEWRAWYIGGGGWIADAGRSPLPTYRLLTLESRDGAVWPRSGDLCLEPSGDEIGFGRPCVLRSAAGYRMWYSVRRRNGYRLGYAESPDGRVWRRWDDRVDIPPQPGFSDAMSCYPAVVSHGDRLLMFYNGNGYGRTGIGVAELAAD